MDSLQIWKYMGDERRQQATRAFYGDQSTKEFHRAADTFIARMKNFRPQFVKKLPAEKRASYLAHLGLTPDLAAQLIVSYHFAHHRPMMAAFLDALGIANDQGLIKDDAEPEAPNKESLDQAVRAIKSQFNEEDVNIYLATLYSQNPQMWAGLETAISVATE